MNEVQNQKIQEALDQFRIETPSWGFADTGTRFGKFLQDAAAIDINDKLADAGQVHALTGICPSVAVHVLWDFRAGHPASGIMILLAPEDAKDNQFLFRRDQSDSDGTFLLSNIVPGRYRLLAIEEGWDLNWADPNVLAAYLKKSIPLQVRAHDKLKQMVEVQSR